ncbi:MAG: hypothetical protein ACO3JL_20280 [Myxococcota bacterium]
MTLIALLVSFLSSLFGNFPSEARELTPRDVSASAVLTCKLGGCNQ